MSYRQPARTAAIRRADMTVYSVRRRRAGLGAVGAVLLGTVAFAAAGPSAGTKARVPTDAHVPHNTSVRRKAGAQGESQVYLSSVTWPQQGQAAIVLGNGRVAASPNEQPVPIASVAKVMTAYLTLKHYPLSGEQGGFAVTVSAARAEAEAQDAADGQSVVPVEAGERLTERQLLEALLIPSGDNIAWLLAARVAGSETRFIDEMNDEAHALGMGHTTYTDPSGFYSSTVSTAADQLRVLLQAMRLPAFRQIASMPSVTLPVAGTLTNFNPLISEGYAGKTGSDYAAGGCLAFFTDVTAAGRELTAAGVVLGQGEGDDTSELLAAAGEAAEQLVDSAIPHARTGAGAP